MRGDLVIVDVTRAEAFRKKQALGKTGFYDAVGVFPRTGAKLLNGKPVSLKVAKRLAKAIGVKVQSIIEGWVEDDGDNNRDVDNDEQQI